MSIIVDAKKIAYLNNADV